MENIKDIFEEMGTPKISIVIMNSINMLGMIMPKSIISKCGIVNQMT
jgi:hypothetical protein